MDPQKVGVYIVLMYGALCFTVGYLIGHYVI